jgi:conjugative relaxase-like TrwC/TraI family protein
MPRNGAQLVGTRRPGVELVVSPHKSVAELGVIGRAEDMHAIVDAERDATLAYLDGECKKIGGRRGEAATPTKTGGLTWVTSRHATTRAGDPQVHDHVLVANVVWMRDTRGGWKGLDTAFLRDQLRAATAVGRLASARVAVELGYAIEADEGRSGRLGGWAIAGLPDEALAVHSQRSAQIDDIAGPDASYRERNAAARQKRATKTHQPVEDLVRRWQTELTEVGYPPEQLIAGIDDAARRRPPVSDRLDNETLAQVLDDVLGDESRLAEEKVFDRADVIVAVAPHLHGLPVSELDNAVGAVIADDRCIPLLGVAGARTQAYATAGVLAAEAHIAALATELAVQPAAAVPDDLAEAAIAAVEDSLAGPMTAGQRDATEGLLTSGAGLDLVVGVAGSGKTTCLAAVRLGFETAGYDVIGTATSGQAARGLGQGAGIGESRTLASLCWRLDHDRIVLTDRDVIVIDETSMTDDVDLGRLLAAACAAKAKVIAVGDDRQLGAVGPGGGLAALLRRHPERVWRLTDNVRQVDPGERAALAELRAGKVDDAVAWYLANGRIKLATSREAIIGGMVARWADDVAGGVDSVLIAWRHVSVDELNRQARHAYAALGRLSGPEIEAPGGRRYAGGDRVITLTPGPKGAWVTSERATVAAIHPADGSLDAVTPDGRRLHLDRDATGAERLTHGYAITAHRSQGSTVDVAHVLEDGGGRELAYVAMSRARHASYAYVACPKLDEAVDRLAWAWGSERRPTWAHDQGRPQPHVDLARLIAERRMLADMITRDTATEILYAHHELAEAEQDLANLHAGASRWASTPAGTAARALNAARKRQAQAERHNADPNLGFLERRQATREATVANGTLAAAEQAWEHRGQPEAEQLDKRRTEVIDRIAVLEDPVLARDAWLDSHPRLAEQIRQLDDRIAVQRSLGIEPAAQAPSPPVHERDIDIGL